MSAPLATFLFELVNFLALAGLLGWLLFKPVRSMLQARQAADTKREEDLAARAAEAERLRAEWQQRTASLEAELTDTRAARLATADQQAAAILAQAREAAQHERDRATKALTHLERAELEKLAKAVAAVSSDAVARLLATLGTPDLEAGLLRAACSQLERLGETSLGVVLVESARPLGEGEREALRTAAGTRATSLAFHVVPSLGVGIRVTTAQGLIDTSAAGLAAAAERRLSEALVTEGPATT